jgi:hypothetical protein
VKNTPTAAFADKTKKVYYTIILSDPTGTMELKLWNNVAALYHADEDMLPKKGDVVEITNVSGYINSYMGAAEWQIKPITDKTVTDFEIKKGIETY